MRGKPTVLGACSGAVAGFGLHHAGSRLRATDACLIMGVAAGALCYFTCTTLKTKLGYDDSLDAFGVHGVGGTLGAVLTGVFATRAVNDVAGGGPVGLLEGGKLLDSADCRCGPDGSMRPSAVFHHPESSGCHDGAASFANRTRFRGWISAQHGEEGYIFI